MRESRSMFAEIPQRNKNIRYILEYLIIIRAVIQHFPLLASKGRLQKKKKLMENLNKGVGGISDGSFSIKKKNALKHSKWSKTWKKQ